VIAVYAMGQGLGHLTRVRAAVHTMGIDEHEVTLLSDSPAAHDRRVVAGMNSVVVPADVAPDPAAMAGWVTATLADLEPDEVWVDAFPGGIRGELNASVVPVRTPVVHLARLLQWSTYANSMPSDPLRFERSYLTEPLTQPHLEWLRAMSMTVTPLDLAEPAAGPDLFAVGTIEDLPPPRWLIAHAGPEDEVLELVAYAQDMGDSEGGSVSLVVAAPNPVEGLATIDTYPVWPLFEHVDRVITAAGFNSMRQAAALGLGDRHRFVPFPRRHDDQFERARRARTGA